MTAQPAPASRRSNAYHIFILVLTVISLAVMVLLLLPLSSATLTLLHVYDNGICMIFLLDFAISLKQAPSKRRYFFAERGWLDLLGSIPSFGFLRTSALFRLARLSRLARITRLLRGQNRKELVHDVLSNRAQYAAIITALLAFVVLTFGSVVVLSAESHASTANIKTGGDALWWSVVTISTVGYGDYYPVTAVGRIGAFFIMVMGVGIIGALASIMASVVVGSGEDTATDSGREPTGVESELAALRSEIMALRQLIEGAGGRVLQAGQAPGHVRAPDRAAPSDGT
jgi:voltage-gated potassium channel